MDMWRAIFSIICSSLFLFETLHSGEPSKRYRRITGGGEMEIHKIPFLVSLRYNKSYFCAGSILNENVILTAASCEKPEVARIKVRVGSRYYNKKGKTIRASEFIPHPEFDNETLERDVAIIILREAMNFTKNIRPVKLPVEGKNLPESGEFVRIAGWGYTDLNSDINSSEEMRSVELPIMSQSTCKNCYPDRQITELVFCGGYFLGGKGPSEGDIGGPVVCKGIQYGIVSFTGEAGAYPMSPAIFTSVSKVRRFIQRYTKVKSEHKS